MNVIDLKNRLPIFLAVLFSSTAPLFGQNLTATGNSKLITPRLEVTSSEDVLPTGGGSVLIGPEEGSNIGIDGNEIMARNNGTSSDLLLNNEGGNVAVGFNSGNTTRFITPIVEAISPSDATPTGGGAIIVGFLSGPNVAIDRNEICLLYTSPSPRD